MSEKTDPLFEQFRDIYCGRATYDDDDEWVANMDTIMELMCDAQGLSFAAQADEEGGSWDDGILDLDDEDVDEVEEYRRFDDSQAPDGDF